MDARVASIAAEAATLSERLGLDWRVTDDVGAAARLARWRDRVGGDLVLRLGWIGQAEPAVLRRLGGGRFERLPDWCDFFAAAVVRDDVYFAEADKHPFGPLLCGFVAEALDRVPAAYGEAFGPVAASTLIDDLFTKLSYLAAPAFQVEFSAFRGAAGGAGDARFLAFDRHMANGGRWDFFAEYAALARLLAICAGQWVAHVGRIAEDFVADRAAIAGCFEIAWPRRIVAIEPSLSDAHNDGRSVAIVTLTGGLRLPYKPRSVGIEVAWFALLAELDGDAGSFRSLIALDRGTRGWVEIAAHAQCPDATAFYRRAGNLLALLYALEASDCFHENIVAAGAFPVLIDMETLMHHLLRPDGASAADDVLFNSVLRAGLLPVWEAGRDNVVVDISGLGAAASQVTPYLRRRWSAINCDAMTLSHEAIRVDSLHHLPLIDGVPLRAADHAEAVIDGFRETYRALIDRREELLAPGGAIAVMGGEMLRLVFHPTRLYGLILKRLSSPKAMRSGVDRSIEFDILARFYVTSPGKALFQALLGAELAALERGDIPYFALRADAVDLPGVADAFAASGIARAASRLMRFDEADLALQTEFVRASLAMSAPSVARRPAADDPSDDAPPATRAEMLSAVSEIVAELTARAIRTGEGATWIAPQLLPHSTRYELRPLRLDLYGGQGGVALFLAAASSVTGEGRELALAALAPLRRGALPGLPTLLANGHTIGAATGIGSIVYVLTRCAGLLELPDLLDDALAAARLLDVETIAADIEHDVMAGVAGAALGLLALYWETQDRAVLRLAAACGDHLLTRAMSIRGGIGWSSGAHPPTTGLSHGAAGIALALARLADATGDRRYRAAAERALAFEASAFDAAAGNWHDLRAGWDAPPEFMNAWCHGALGIGLARIAMRGERRDIEAALALNRWAGLGAKDGLCCGNLARAELLLSAGDATGAEAITGRVLNRAARRGQFALTGTAGTELFMPGFFQGLSGIGYQLLRTCSPGLPRVLTWD